MILKLARSRSGKQKNAELETTMKKEADMLVLWKIKCNSKEVLEYEI